MANSVTIHLTKVEILSAAVNVRSFMYEYALGNKYQWAYSTTSPGSTYNNEAYLDLGVITNTGRYASFLLITLSIRFILTRHINHTTNAVECNR
jgi:hypothetical protein